MTLRISWSGLKTHESCKQQGFLTRTGKKAALTDQRVFFAGNVTDRTVRQWLENSPEKNPGAMPDMVAQILDDQERYIIEGDPEKKVPPGVIRWKSDTDREEVRAECIKAVTKIEPLLQKYVVPFEHKADYAFEAPLQLRHPDGSLVTISLIGYMDIIVRDDKGRFWVWDVKHTKNAQYWRKTLAQLGFYDLAVELIYGQPMVAGGLMQPLIGRSIVPYQPTEESRTQLRQRVNAMARDIWVDDKTPRADNTECNVYRCPVMHACEKFKPIVQEDGSRRIKLGRR